MSNTLIPYEDKVKLLSQLKKLKYIPPTGHGKIFIEVNIVEGDITTIDVLTKNKFESEAESKYVRRAQD